MFMVRETRFGKHSVALTALILAFLSSPILALGQAPTPSAAQAPPAAAAAQNNPPSIRVGSELVLFPAPVATKKATRYSPCRPTILWSPMTAFRRRLISSRSGSGPAGAGGAD